MAKAVQLWNEVTNQRINIATQEKQDEIIAKLPVLESNGAMPINIQDQTSEIIDLHLTQIIDTLTIDVNTAIDDVVVRISSDTLPVVGNVVCFKEGTAFYQGEILAVSLVAGTQYDITLDTPLDYAYTTAGGCSLRSEDLNVNGSVTKQIFAISPANLQAGTKWDIVRIIFVITDDVVMDDEKFGGLTALTNGIVLRRVDGTYKNIFNVKTNADFIAHSYDVDYSAKAPAGFYGFRCRRTFGGQDKNGVVIRLDADTSDELQVIVQDDLSALTRFHVIVQGHVVTD